MIDMNQTAFWVLGILVPLLLVILVVVIITMTRGRLRRLRAAVEQRGWKWLSSNSSDYRFQGETQGISWTLAGENYDLRVIWQTEDVPRTPYKFNVLNRNTAVSQGFEVVKKVGKHLAPEHFSGREEVLNIGSPAFQQRYAVVTDLQNEDEANRWLTSSLEDLLVRYPAGKSIEVHYTGRTLYVIARVSSFTQIYDMRLINTAVRIGVTTAKAWAQP